MTQASIHHLEKTPAFLHRIVELNRIHSHDEQLASIAHDGPETGPQARASRQALVRIHKGFPEAPLFEQAAYLVRAFNGVRPFPEANHRTAWDYLDGLVRHHGRRLLADEAEGRALGNEVFVRIREEHPDGLPLEEVAERDGTYEWLAQWFRHRIN